MSADNRKDWGRTVVKGVSVANCPIGLDVCYPSCYFWRDEKCDYKRIMEEVNCVEHPPKG